MKRLFATICVLLALSGMNAQTLSLDDCRKMALEHNKTLASSRVKLEQTKFDMKSYKANFFPKVTLHAFDAYSTMKGDLAIDAFKLPIKKFDFATGSYNYDVTVLPDGTNIYNNIIDFPGIKEQWKVQNVFSGGITLLEPIYAGGKINTAYKMSKIGMEMATENIRLSESEVLVSTEEAYFLAIKARKLGEVARSYKQLLDELLKNVQGAADHGMATRNDVLKVQVKLNEAELSIKKADNGYALARMNLCHVIGMSLSSEISVEDIDFDLNTIASDYVMGGVEARPEHSILEHKTELARHNVNIVKSDYLPSVMLGATYSYGNGVELAGKKLFDGGSASVGVMVKVPVDLFGSTSNKVRSAKASYKLAQLEAEELNDRMMLEIKQCHNQVVESATEVTLCAKSLEQAQQSLDMSKKQYEVGLEPLSNYLESQAMWQKVASSLVDAQCSYLLSLTKFRKATGTL